MTVNDGDYQCLECGFVTSRLAIAAQRACPHCSREFSEEERLDQMERAVGVRALPNPEPDQAGDGRDSDPSPSWAPISQKRDGAKDRRSDAVVAVLNASQRSIRFPMRCACCGTANGLQHKPCELDWVAPAGLLFGMPSAVRSEKKTVAVPVCLECGKHLQPGAGGRALEGCFQIMAALAGLGGLGAMSGHEYQPGCFGLVVAGVLFALGEHAKRRSIKSKRVGKTCARTQPAYEIAGGLYGGDAGLLEATFTFHQRAFGREFVVLNRPSVLRVDGILRPGWK